MILPPLDWSCDDGMAWCSRPVMEREVERVLH